MPLYEYQCPECGHEEDFLQGFNDPVPDCPKCLEYYRGIDPENLRPWIVMKRKISLPSRPVFKGSGFYENDYKEKKR